MGILISVISMAIASIVGVFKGIDMDHPNHGIYEKIIWLIIVIGFLPLAFEYVQEKYRELMRFLNKSEKTSVGYSRYPSRSITPGLGISEVGIIILILP